MALGTGLATSLLGACGAAPTPATDATAAQPTTGGAAQPTAGAASAPTTAAVATAPAQPAGPVKLTLSTDWNSGVRKQTIEDWIDLYQQAHPNVTIEALHLGAGGFTEADYGGTIQTMLIAGRGPDVIMEFWWRPTEMLLNLDPFLTGQNIKKEDYWWSPNYQEVDGKTYSLPLGTYTGGFIANVDLFEKAGLPLPEKGWTFDDLRTLAGQLKGDNVWGLERQTGSWNQGWTERMASEGADWYDFDTLTSTLDQGKDGGDPVKMFADWWGLVWKDHVAPAPDDAAGLMQVAAGAGSASNLFPTGRIAISGLAFNQIGIVKDLVGDRFRMQALWPPTSPYSGRRGYYRESSNVAVGKETTNRGHAEEAFDVAFFWLGDTMSHYLTKNLPVMPPARKWFRDPAVLSALPGMEIFPDLAEEAWQIGWDRHKWITGSGAAPNSLEWFKLLRTKFQDVALVGGADPVETFKAVLQEGDPILQKKV